MLPHLRPLDTGEILDGAFRLYRTHFRAFLAAGLLPLSPLLLFWGYIAWQAAAGVPMNEQTTGELTTLLMFAGWVPALITRGIVIRMADDAQTGRPVNARAATRDALRRFPALLWASALTNVIIALPFLLGTALVVGLPGVTDFGVLAFFYVLFGLCSAALAAAWSGTLPAVVLERTSGNAGRGRSWTLARGGVGKVAAVWTIGVALVWLPWVAVEALLAFFTPSTETGTAFAVSSLLCQASAAFTVPLVAAARTLLFNDLRVRVEALDVRLLAERLAPVAA
ncbi:MAG TPA: hypothetical protein VFY65_07435 [Longimicrobium sp.]|nr:hypothetical protein [Longimicrobium sp.]